MYLKFRVPLLASSEDQRTYLPTSWQKPMFIRRQNYHSVRAGISQR